MGIELAILSGLTLGSAYLSGKSQQNQSQDQAELYAQQANAVAEEGALKANEKAKEIARLASSQKVSFLQSGVTLQGTPMNVLSDTFKTGKEDIALIGKNYQTQANNLVNQANLSLKSGRSAYIGSLMSGVASVGSMAVMGGLGSSLPSFSSSTLPQTGMASGGGWGAIA